MDQIQDLLGNALDRLGPAAAVDIALIWAIIFGLLMALRGTAAMTLLRGGVAVIFGLFILGQVLNLSVVNFILRNSLSGLVVGVIVIFQPEIRRALERAGRTSVRSLLSNADQDLALDAISEAVVQLARRRHGAIIVIERGTGLEEYIDTGVRIDAGLNARLIESMFFPNSALHDKAMIVRDKRIVAAGCTLPLSTSAPAMRMGTRHRAGLGISEQTDAIAVVVSEETGSVSIASEGRLIPLRDETRVRTTLEALASRRTGFRATPVVRAT